MNINAIGGQLRSLMTNQPTLESFLKDAGQWNLRDLKSFVNHWKYSAVKKMLEKHKNNIDGALNYLDMSSHSLAFSYLIGFKACQNYEDANEISKLINQISLFLQTADNKQICIQARPTTDALKFLVTYMKQENAIALIEILKNAINLLKSNDNELTYAHCELMEICACNYYYNMAFPQISSDIISVQGNGCIESYDNLRYHYYGACIYIGLKNFDKALELLTMVCSAPSETISVIQIAAYKKYILSSLIYKQQLIQLPRYTPGLLKRYYVKFCSIYNEIAQTFNAGLSIVAKLAEKNYDIFNNDGNWGLVGQVIKSLEKNAVRKLTSVYTRLSIAKVAQLCQFESVDKAKSVLISMIKNGELAAKIDSQGVVKFEQEINQNDLQMLKTIHSRIKNTVNLWNNLDTAQLEIKKSPQYIKKNLDIPGVNEQPMMQEAVIQSMMGMGGGFQG